MGRTRSRAAIMIMAVVAAGCGGPAAQAPSRASPPPAGVSVSLGQWRSDEAEHYLEVSVRNTTTTPVHFSRVQLVTGSFKTLPAHPVDTTIGRTPRTDLRIPYGEAVCEPGTVPPVRPATVIAEMRVGGGPLHEVRFALPHPDKLLSRLVVEECGAYVLRQKVDVTFGESWTPEREDGVDTMRGTLTIVRRSGTEAIEIVDLGNTTHFNLRPVSGKHRPVVVLAAGQQRLELPVTLSPARCDPHAFAEAKKAFLFPVFASTAGGEPRWLIASPPKPMQLMFTNYARKACGFPGA